MKLFTTYWKVADFIKTVRKSFSCNILQWFWRRYMSGRIRSKYNKTYRNPARDSDVSLNKPISAPMRNCLPLFRTWMHLTDRKTSKPYPHVSVVFANNKDEADTLLEDYISQATSIDRQFIVWSVKLLKPKLQLVQKLLNQEFLRTELLMKLKLLLSRHEASCYHTGWTILLRWKQISAFKIFQQRKLVPCPQPVSSAKSGKRGDCHNSQRKSICIWGITHTFAAGYFQIIYL